MAAPRLFIGPLTGKVYVSRRYKERGDGLVEITGEKIDITEQFEDTVCAYLARLGEGARFLGDGLNMLVERVNARNESRTLHRVHADSRLVDAAQAVEEE